MKQVFDKMLMRAQELLQRTKQRKWTREINFVIFDSSSCFVLSSYILFIISEYQIFYNQLEEKNELPLGHMPAKLTNFWREKLLVCYNYLS